MFGLLTVLAWTASAASLSEELRGSRPNIVVVFLDDTGIGDAGVYNPATKETVNIDSIASEGLVIDDHHAGSSVCTPSRAALLTGRLGARTGVYQNFNTDSLGGLPTAELTLAELLRTAGYRSAMFGKWHLGHHAPFHPSYRGFDLYRGLPYSNDMGCTNTEDYDLPPISPCPFDSSPFSTSGLDGPWSAESSETDRLLGYNRPTTPTGPLAVPLYNSTTNCSMADCNSNIIEQPVNLTTLNGRYATWASEFIAEAAAGSQPFLVYLATEHMHVPLAHDPRFNNASARNTIFGDTLVEADNTVGAVWEAIKSSPAANNTLLFITTDNGPWNVKCEYSGSQAQFHGQYQQSTLGGGGTGKFTTWEGGHRSFGIAWWPGRIGPRRTPALTSNLDIVPTVASLAGVTLPNDRSYDGMDLSSVLFDGSDQAHDALFHPDGSGELNAMRYGELKVFYQTYAADACGGGGAGNKHVHDPPLIFNLTADPGESTPITVSPAILSAINSTRNAKLRDIASTFASKADYSGGGANAWACCNPNHVSCRCTQ